MQIARVVIVRVIVDGCTFVSWVVVLIGHDEVLVIYVSICCCDFLQLEVYSLHHVQSRLESSSGSHSDRSRRLSRTGTVCEERWR